LVIWYLGLALPIIDAKGKFGFSHAGFSRNGTYVSATVLTEFARETLDFRRRVLTVAEIHIITISFILGNAFSTVQTNMLATGTYFKLMFTLNTKITFWADTMFPETMRLVESLEFIAKLMKEFCIFRSWSATSAI
jgi:hypothetical protein